jgi:hypothetical protein
LSASNKVNAFILVVDNDALLVCVPLPSFWLAGNVC